MLHFPYYKPCIRRLPINFSTFDISRIGTYISLTLNLQRQLYPQS